MSLKKTKILGIDVTTDSKESILEYIRKYLETTQRKPLIIATPNPEQVVLAQRDIRFCNLINRADVAIPDGIGLALVSGVKKISGVELMEELCQLASERSLRIGLIGGRGGVAVKALECLQRKYPGLEGWAEEPGDYNDYKNYNDYNVYNKIQNTKTKLVFVGLGAPKQECFIEDISRQTSVVRQSEDRRPASPAGRLKTDVSVVLMSVGGAFDEISGRLPKPSRFIESLGLKWFWRLVLEPWRWKRQLALLKFVWLVIREKFASKG